MLEALVNPSVDELLAPATQTAGGTLEVLPPEASQMLIIWSCNRVASIRLTKFSINEDAFDPWLNPLRARVSLGLRVLSTDDLGFRHKGAGMFISHLRTRETLAGKAGAATIASLGLNNLP